MGNQKSKVEQFPKGTPAYFMYFRRGPDSCRFLEKWSKLALENPKLQWPLLGSWDKDRVDALKSKLILPKTKLERGEVDCFMQWWEEANHRLTESKLTSLKNSIKKLTVQLDAVSPTTSPSAPLCPVLCNDPDQTRPPPYSCANKKSEKEKSSVTTDNESEEDTLIGLAALQNIMKKKSKADCKDSLDISSWKREPDGRLMRDSDQTVVAPLRVLKMRESESIWDYKPWTHTELLSIVKSFPKPQENSLKFAEEFLLICETYEPSETDLLQLCKLLAPASYYEKWLAAADWPAEARHSTIKSTGPDSAYRDRCMALWKRLHQAIPKAWSPKTNWTAIHCCKQGQGESPGDYRSRLTDIFLQHSGIQEPDVNGQGALAHAFVDGLLPATGSMFKRISVGWETETMDKLLAVAEHCHRTLKGKEEQSSQKLMALQIQHYSGLSRPHRGQGRGCGRGRGAGLTGVCNYCKQPGHWKKECPRQPNNCMGNQVNPPLVPPADPQPYFSPQQ
ncbi:unnamed protein product [Lepidochelys olivacea]